MSRSEVKDFGSGGGDVRTRLCLLKELITKSLPSDQERAFYAQWMQCNDLADLMNKYPRRINESKIKKGWMFTTSLNKICKVCSMGARLFCRAVKESYSLNVSF